MLSPNFKKNTKDFEKSKPSQNYRLYTNTRKSCATITRPQTYINQQTLEMLSPCQNSINQFSDKHTINRKRTEKLLEYNEGIKEVEHMDAHLSDWWRRFLLEKDVLLYDIKFLLKLKDNNGFEEMNVTLLEDLENFFKQVNNLPDVLEVPANHLVSKILMRSLMDSTSKSRDLVNLENDIIPQKSIISKSVQVLLTVAQIKEMFSQKLMIEKICENKGLQIRNYDSIIHLHSLDRKLQKQKEKLKQAGDSLKGTENERNELRKLLKILIEKSGTLSNGVNALFRIMESNNDMQKNLQMIASRGSPLRVMLSENQQYTVEKEKVKVFSKENMPSSENDTNKHKTIFSPLKAKQTGGGTDSEKDMMTPKTATFAEVSKASFQLTLGYKNSPDTGSKQSDFKARSGLPKVIPFHRKSIEQKTTKIKTRLFSEKKIMNNFPNQFEDFSLNDLRKQTESTNLFNKSKFILENKNSFNLNIQEKVKEINPKISNPNNISKEKSQLEGSITKVIQSLSQMKGSSLPLKKKENLSNPSTFILKNLTSVSNSIISESQPESLQNNTIFKINKILTLGRQEDFSQNLNHRVTKFRKGSTLTKDPSQSVIKDLFNDDMSVITGKVSFNNKNESVSSKQKGLGSKVSGHSEMINCILKNSLGNQFLKMKKGLGDEKKVEVTNSELKKQLDKLKDISESFVEVKNHPKFFNWLNDVQEQLEKSSKKNQEDPEMIKLDTGSRVIDSGEIKSRPISKILSTQTGNQIKDDQEESEVISPVNESPERQILPLDLVEVTSYSKMEKVQEISDYECDSPVKSELNRTKFESVDSNGNPLCQFQSENTVKNIIQATIPKKQFTKKKSSTITSNYKKETFSSSKKKKKRRYSSNKSTNKKELNRKSYSIQNRKGLQVKSKSRSPPKLNLKNEIKIDIRNSLWKNEKKPGIDRGSWI